MVRLQKFPTLSIIIPTLNEANHLPLLLADLNSWPYDFDITIIDGGSKDLTIEIAHIYGINIIKSPKPNRGYQLKAGASNAKGDWFLFLHADSRLAPKWEKNLITILENKESANYGWYFDFKIKKNKLEYRILEKAVSVRSHYLQRPYGDQGLLIHKNLYSLSGGYSSLELMEDLDLIIRITKTNKVKSIGKSIYTDDIKWSKTNIIIRAIKNAKLRKKWREGYQTENLSKEYY